MYLLLIRYKSPQIYLKVVRIHLHLLQTKLAKCPQTYTLQQSLHYYTVTNSLQYVYMVLCWAHLEHDLNDASHNGQFVELNSCKYLYPLIEELLNVA